MRATVVEFDGARGLGRLVTEDGEALGFHCVSIVDGSRSIAVGAAVEARRAVGRLGRDEAVDVTPLSDRRDERAQPPGGSDEART